MRPKIQKWDLLPFVSSGIVTLLLPRAKLHIFIWREAVFTPSFHCKPNICLVDNFEKSQFVCEVTTKRKFKRFACDTLVIHSHLPDYTRTLKCACNIKFDLQFVTWTPEKLWAVHSVLRLCPDWLYYSSLITEYAEWPCKDGSKSFKSTETPEKDDHSAKMSPTGSFASAWWAHRIWYAAAEDLSWTCSKKDQNTHLSFGWKNPYQVCKGLQCLSENVVRSGFWFLINVKCCVHTAVVWSGFITHGSNICPHASSVHSPDRKRICYYCELWRKSQTLSSDWKIQSNTMHTVLSQSFSQVPRDSVSSDSHLLMSVSYLTASRHCITRKHSHSDWFPPETSRLVFALSTWQLRRGNSLIQGKEFAVWHKVWQSHVSRPSLLDVCVNHCRHKQDKGQVVPDGPLQCIYSDFNTKINEMVAKEW